VDFSEIELWLNNWKKSQIREFNLTDGDNKEEKKMK
jgi:hypothetical protein